MNERTPQSFFLIWSKECLTQISLITVFSFPEKKFSVAVVKWWNTKQTYLFDASNSMQTRQYMLLVWCVYKITCTTAVYITLIVWDIVMKKIKERTKTSNWILGQFSLSFVSKPSLTWMLYFHVRFQNKWKILSLEWIL